MDYTAEQLEALYDLLPDTLSEVMYGDERERVMRHLTNRYKLSNEQKEGLDIALDDVILGITVFEALPKELVGYLDVSPSIAGNIAQDIYDFLLTDVKSSIDEMVKKKEGFDSTIKKSVREEMVKEGAAPVTLSVKHAGAENPPAPPSEMKEISPISAPAAENKAPVPAPLPVSESERRDNSTIGKVRLIGNRFGLELDQIAILVKEADDVLNKITTPTLFPEKISTRLGIAPEDGKKIAEELNSAIFLPKKISVFPPKVVMEEEKPRVVSLDEGSDGTTEGAWPKDFSQFLGGKEREFEKLGNRLRLEKVNRDYEIATAPGTETPAPLAPLVTEAIAGATGFENKPEEVHDLAPSEELASPKKAPVPSRYDIDPYREMPE